MQLPRFLLGPVLWAAAHAALGSPFQDPASSVLEVRAYSRAGTAAYGSAVAVRPGGLVTSCHVVVALHDYGGALVVQVSAPFDYGASGGGLFDEDGRLVGILTFKAKAGGPFHFAVPIAWLDDLADGACRGGRQPFRQRPARDLPYFLRAAALEAAGIWGELRELADEWIRAEPYSPGAARALAHAGLRRATYDAPYLPPLFAPVLSRR